MEANSATSNASVKVDDRLIAEARRQEIRALAAMDGLDLADESIMAKAWRSWLLDVKGHVSGEPSHLGWHSGTAACRPHREKRL